MGEVFENSRRVSRGVGALNETSHTPSEGRLSELCHEQLTDERIVDSMNHE
ncbi:hypothetical protein U27_05936 [Candidatus Vecturithrix granuli]|uniref:Uncharacterized protein n=1 Tax=Vecturithrix granuli TaxID=1499967 RepID=A0A081C306_VECG1|nr:hypothetical protein U27_05936 [Candidatus Vecturithrix granuli]